MQVFIIVKSAGVARAQGDCSKNSSSQFAGLTRLQLDEVGRERQVQQQGRQRAEALAERSVEIAQAMVPLAGALARGGG